MKKHFALILFMMIACATCTIAQEAPARQHKPQHERLAPRFNPQEFRQKLETYVRQNAALTDEEAATLLPLMHEMHDKMRSINDEMRQTKNEVGENATPQQAETAITRLATLKANEANVVSEYYKRMCRAANPCKVMMTIKAVDTFHKEMLRKGNAPGMGHKEAGMRNRGGSHHKGKQQRD